MKTFEIGQSITYTTSTGTYTGVVKGRNWMFDKLESYIVRHDGCDIPICAKTFNSQLSL